MRPVLLACLLTITALPAIAADKVVRLTSLDWPPYSGAALKDGGASVVVVRAALAAVDVKLEVEFLPWKRAVETARGNAAIAGYFPEYAEVGAEFVISDRIGTSPLGFAQRVEAPILWTSLANLKAVAPIGVVDGYINESAFDAAIADGSLKADVARDDATNIRKLAGGRMRAAVIDRNVLAWLLAREPALADSRGKISFNERLLDDKTLHVAFSGAHGLEARALLSEGLKRIDIDSVSRPYLLSRAETMVQLAKR